MLLIHAPTARRSVTQRSEATVGRVWPLKGTMPTIYISSSWKNRVRVREIATLLRMNGFEVYDFTDPKCRKTPEIPPETFPEQFDPLKHQYRSYLESTPQWRQAVEENRKALLACDVCVLLLPCGADSHADWGVAVGAGKPSIVMGHPKAGERTPSHLWSDAIIPDDNDDLLRALECIEHHRDLDWPARRRSSQVGD
jgi:hypothetical protein